MRVVQTSFIDDKRIEQRLTVGEIGGLWKTGNGRLIVARRRPKNTDWVNGAFVGDHEEPEDEEQVHVHGEPT